MESDMSNKLEMPMQYNSLSDGIGQPKGNCTPTRKCTQVGLVENVKPTLPRRYLCNGATRGESIPTSERRARVHNNTYHTIRPFINFPIRHTLHNTFYTGFAFLCQ